MELLTELFVTHGPVQTVLVLSATIVFGILLGRISIGGILFSGIIIGHFGFCLIRGCWSSRGNSVSSSLCTQWACRWGRSFWSPCATKACA